MFVCVYVRHLGLSWFSQVDANMRMFQLNCWAVNMSSLLNVVQCAIHWSRSFVVFIFHFAKAHTYKHRHSVHCTVSLWTIVECFFFLFLYYYLNLYRRFAILCYMHYSIAMIIPQTDPYQIWTFILRSTSNSVIAAFFFLFLLLAFIAIDCNAMQRILYVLDSLWYVDSSWIHSFCSPLLNSLKQPNCALCTYSSIVRH